MNHFFLRGREALMVAAFAAAPLLIPSSAFAAPIVSEVSPVTATSNVSVTFNANVSSATPIQYCHLYVDLEDVGEMTVSSGVASRAFTFSSGGSRIAFVFCRDTNGGLAAGPNTAIWVTGPIVTSPPLSTPSPQPNPAPVPVPEPVPVVPTSTFGIPPAGSLIKLDCPPGVAADHPCKAVYYVGRDGKRHAFPTEHVFFTWYTGFDAVVTVSSATMSGFPLGSNVTYRPGVRMVKFTSVSNVYAVGRGGALRWVKTEEVARTLYGADWTTQIDDIAESFFTNYHYGEDINAASDYHPTVEAADTASIDDNF